MNQIKSNTQKQHTDKINPEEVYAWIDLSNYYDDLNPKGRNYLSYVYTKINNDLAIRELELSYEQKLLVSKCLEIINKYPSFKERLGNL